MKARKEFLIVITILYIGFIYRLFLSSLAESRLFWDMSGYHSFAVDFLSGRLVADCCLKNVGHGAFLALVYFIFGENNLAALRIVQVLIDLVTAALIYLIARRLFNKKTAFYSFVLYIINPFTSAYTGLRLAETVSLFYITLIAFIISQPSFKTSKFLWIILGVLLGLLLFARAQYYYFVFVFMILSAILFFKKANRVYFVVFSLFGFLIASSYSLVSYYKNFKVLSLVPPYSSFYGGLYQNFYNDRRYPELAIDFPKINPHYTRVAMEYYQTEIPDKPLYEKKYQALFWQKFQKEWPLFFMNMARNMVFMWDKDHLYAYTDPFYPYDKIPLRIFNIALLFLFLAGVVAYLKREKLKTLHSPLAVYTIFLFFYITFIFSLVSNESRHSMAFYSLMMLWAGRGVVKIGEKIR